MARTSTLTGGSNNAQTTSEDLNGVATDLISADGVVGALTNTSGVAPMTGGLAVNAQGSPNKTTAVTAGTAYVTATPTSQNSQRLRVKIDAQNVTHADNTSGGTRYDWIYVTISAANAANPSASMDNVGTITVSRSTSSSTDNGTPPTYGYCIAKVTLTNGFSSVTNGNIADVRTQVGMTSNAVVAGSVVPEDLVTGTGTTWVWSDWTPTYANITVGNGTVSARYKQIGKTVHFSYTLVLGSTSAIGSSPTFTLPVTAYSAGKYNFTAYALDSGTTRVPLFADTFGSTTVVGLFAVNTAGTYGSQATITSTVPFTWTTSDELHIDGAYEAA